MSVIFFSLPPRKKKEIKWEHQPRIIFFRSRFSSVNHWCGMHVQVGTLRTLLKGTSYLRVPMLLCLMCYLHTEQIVVGHRRNIVASKYNSPPSQSIFFFYILTTFPSGKRNKAVNEP